MGKFAPVCPHHIYEQFLEHNYIPSSVLLLAHDVVEHPKEFSKLFGRPEWMHTTIFMDNSLVELKCAVDIEMVASAVKIIDRPQVVVICPDVMAESEASTKATIDAWPEWSRRFQEYEKLVVLQGNTMQSWLACAEALSTLRPEWVSIPRVTENLFGYHRRELIPFVNTLFYRSKIHLLGFSDYIWEDLRAAAHPAVRSIDSAVPLRMKTPNTLSEKIPPRGNWWETCEFSKDMIKRCQEIESWIYSLEIAAQ